MTKNVLTIDAGTTAIKICIVDEKFHILSCVSREYDLHTEDNRVTLNPEIYWDNITSGIREILKENEGVSIAGISVTTQGETMIPVDAEGNALYDAVVWLDGRAVAQAEEINRRMDKEFFYMTTGVPECNALCPISKLLWFYEEEREIYDKTKYFMLLEDYILFHLTGRMVTEKSLLSTTGYFDIVRDKVWDELLLMLHLDPAKIPPAFDCGSRVGKVSQKAAEETGISEQVWAVTGAMDQVCGAIGAGNFYPGGLTETTGTALCIGKTMQKQSVDPRYPIPVYRHYKEDLQLLLPVCMTAGMALKWFKDTFCETEIKLAGETGKDVYTILSELAEESQPLAGGVVMLPYLAGSLQPYQSDSYRGGFLGVGLNSRKKDFIRALMEGVSYMLKENLVLLQQIGANGSTIISMGGGSRSDLWCQIKADVTGLTVYTLKESEVASIGAAMLCRMGLEDGKVLSGQDLTEQVRKTYSPQADRQQQYLDGYRRYSDLLKNTISLV